MVHAIMGEDLEKLCNELGVSSEQQEFVYCKITWENLKETLQKMNRLDIIQDIKRQPIITLGKCISVI